MSINATDLLNNPAIVRLCHRVEGRSMKYELFARNPTPLELQLFAKETLQS